MFVFGTRLTEVGCIDDFKPKAWEIQRKATRTGAACSSFMARARVESSRVLASLLAASIYVEKI
jgi:hypothetical protein